MICIGLFLFYMLNSVPAVLKNVLIILWSSRFVSRDINNVARIHYWRTSSYWAGLRQVFFREKFHFAVIDSIFRKMHSELPVF